MNFTLLDDTDISQAYTAHLRDLRQQATLSRTALAERSCVPAATIKKFERDRANFISPIAVALADARLAR